MVRLVFIQLRVLTDIIQYVVYHCTLLQLLNTVLLFFSESLNQTTLKSPGFENGNLDRPKPWDADSKHVLYLCADTSSRLGYLFFLATCFKLQPPIVEFYGC